MKKYIYKVEAIIGSNSCFTSFIIICYSTNEIYMLIKDKGYDKTNMYGEPKEPSININSIQKLGRLGIGSDEVPCQVIEIYRFCCDIVPNKNILL